MVHYFNKYSHLLLGCVIFCYLFLRVINVPISDDEFLTYREFVHGDILTILTSGKPDVYWTPNNHILNTLLIKLSLWIFGEHDWAFRIHILIAFIACYYFVFKILSNHIKSPGRILAYLGILFLNAYLLDFFSLARGYAISMAGWSAAFYYFMKYYEGAATTHNLAISWICLFIAVWSNFSALYFLPLFGLLFLLRLLLDRKTGLNKFHLFLFPASLIVIVAVVIVPLSKAFAAGTLVWGSGNFFQDSFVASVDYYSHYNLNMGRFKMVTEHWSRMEFYALVLIIGWVFSQGISWWLKPSEPLRKVHFALLFQCVGLTVLVVALHNLFNTPYPYHRVALLYSFPFLLALFFSFETILKRFSAINLIIWGMFGFCVWHSGYSWNLENTMEWYQNGDAKKVFAYIETEIAPKRAGEKIVLGAEQWQYFSMAYYAQTAYKDIVKLEFTTMEKPEKYDYLYAPNHRINEVGDNYQLVKEFKHGVLFQYKEK